MGVLFNCRLSSQREKRQPMSLHHPPTHLQLSLKICSEVGPPLRFLLELMHALLDLASLPVDVLPALCLCVCVCGGVNWVEQMGPGRGEASGGWGWQGENTWC